MGSKKDRLDFEQFHKFYNHIMFEQNEVNVKVGFFCWEATKIMSSHKLTFMHFGFRTFNLIYVSLI